MEEEPTSVSRVSTFLDEGEWEKNDRIEFVRGAAVMYGRDMPAKEAWEKAIQVWKARPEGY